MQRKNKKSMGRTDESVPVALKHPNAVVRPFLFNQGGCDVELEKKARSDGSFDLVTAGHCACSGDDLRGQSNDIRRLVTMTREQARREVLNLHRRWIFSMLDKCLRGGR